MNRSVTALVWLVAMLAPSFAFASSAVTGAAVVVERFPISLQKTRDLNFGRIMPSASSPGAVVVSVNGTVSATGGAFLVDTTAARSAAYVVTGVPNTPFSVTLPTSASLSGPTGPITVGTFVASNGSTGTLSTSGTASFSVGARLGVPAGLLPGTYTGTFAVTVAYN